MKIDVMDVRKGDIVRFASFALRVEAEPTKTASTIKLHGRISKDGSPIVTRTYFKGTIVTVDR